MPSVTGGKRSVKSVTSTKYEGASAAQKVRAAQWCGELAWNHGQGQKASGSSSSQYHVEDATYSEPWFEDQGDGSWKCLLCNCYADEAHIAGKKHQQRASAPQYYGYSALSISVGGSAPDVATGAAPVPVPAWPYIAYVTEGGSLQGDRWPKCLLCNKWCQDTTSHAGDVGSWEPPPGVSKEHAKNLRNSSIADAWYRENVDEVRRKWHPIASHVEQQGQQQQHQPQEQRQQKDEQTLEPWLEMRNHCPYCLVCNKYADEKHLGSHDHIRRLEYWSQSDDVGCLDPWIEKRDDGSLFCLACRKFATPEHLATADHSRRAQVWAHSDDTLPGVWAVRKEGQVFCVACHRFCTEEHRQSPRHLWRAQLYAAGRGDDAEPDDVVRATVTDRPSKKQPSFIAQRGDGSEDRISKDLFSMWPLKPRKGDVLLLPTGSGESQRPVLTGGEALSLSEMKAFATRLGKIFEDASKDNCTTEACATMVADYYWYVKHTLSCMPATAPPESCEGMLRMLHAALSASGVAISVLLRDVRRSDSFWRVVATLSLEGRLNADLVFEVVDKLVDLWPQILSQVRPVLHAAYDSCLKELPRLGVPSQWYTSPEETGWGAIALVEGSEAFEALRAALATDAATLASKSSASGQYRNLALKRAWRIENHTFWQRYAENLFQWRKGRLEAEKASLEAVSLYQPRLRMPALSLREELEQAFAALPEGTAKAANEVRLLLGTRPEEVAAFANEELFPCSGKFGKGILLAEDAGRADRDASPDLVRSSKELKDMHTKLYGKGYKSTQQLQYIFVCRTALGHFARINHSKFPCDELTTQQQVYHSADRRSLCAPFESVVVEVGNEIRTYREFLQCNVGLIYPEYLVAYARE